MVGKAVTGVGGVELAHEPVAVLFGDDGGCGDRGAGGIALDHRFLRHLDVDGVNAVDQNKIGRRIKLIHRPNHSQKRRAQNVYPVDLTGLY